MRSVLSEYLHLLLFFFISVPACFRCTFSLFINITLFFSSGKNLSCLIRDRDLISEKYFCRLDLLYFSTLLYIVCDRTIYVTIKDDIVYVEVPLYFDKIYSSYIHQCMCHIVATPHTVVNTTPHTAVNNHHLLQMYFNMFVHNHFKLYHLIHGRFISLSLWNFI